MTDLARALPKSVLTAVDRYRALYGIRSRAKAVEAFVPEYPLEVTLRNAEKLPKGSVSPEILEQFEESRRLQAEGLEKFISLEEAMKRCSRNK
jgi:trehalose-6-phosphate synthase